MLPLTRYDLTLVLRTASAGLLLAISILLIGMATDEPGSSLGGRLGRLAALLPIAGGVAAALIVAQARARGESRALAALGVGPVGLVRGAWIGAVLVGLAGPSSIAAGAAEIASLFPRVEAQAAWRFVEGAWLDENRGLAVLAGGELEYRAVIGAPGPSHRDAPTAATVLALLFTSLAAPAWALTSRSATRRAIVLVASAFAAVTSFHLVGAQKLTPWALLIAPSLLLLDLCAYARDKSLTDKP